MATGKPDAKFPSWSWADWDGLVDYALFQWVTNIAERSVHLIEAFYLEGLKIYPDKYEEAACLMQQAKTNPTKSSQDEDKLPTEDSQGFPEMFVLVNSAAKSPASEAQNLSGTHDDSETSESEELMTTSYKGKEKALEEVPQTGKQ